MRSRDPEARLVGRALREAWPVPAAKRSQLVAKLIEVALAPWWTPRGVWSDRGCRRPRPGGSLE
jgi:hypothetical protein